MNYYFFAGCYTSGSQDKGIHLLRLDSDSGKLSLENSFYGGENPSFLIRQGKFLYAANEVSGTGKASAFSVGNDNQLTLINSREAAGAGTCHIAYMNGFLYGANYESGSIFGVEISADGALGKVVSEIQHEGTGPNQDRQKEPHAHSVNPVPGENLLIAADLGTDKLFCYRQNADGSLKPDGISPAVKSPPGGGPRHLTFSPDVKRMFAVMEMGVSLVSYIISANGFEHESVYPLVKEEIFQRDIAADIHFNPAGTRLYASVRGKNLISVFEFTSAGTLNYTGFFSSGGDSPRNFCFSPDGKFILIAHQSSGDVTICPVNENNGFIGSPLDSVNLQGASCIINA